MVSQELEAIKARVREMEEEAEKLKELQNEVEKQMNLSPPPGKWDWMNEWGRENGQVLGRKIELKESIAEQTVMMHRTALGEE